MLVPSCTLELRLKANMMINALKRSIDLITEYVIEFHAPNKLAATQAGLKRWVNEIPMEANESERLSIQRGADRVGYYEVIFRETWWRKKGELEPFGGAHWHLILTDTRTRTEFVTRVSAQSRDEEQVSEAIVSNAANGIFGGTFFWGCPNKLRQTVRQADKPILRIEFDKFWGPKVKDDMLAQLCVETMQTGFSGPNEVRDFLVSYVSKTMTKTIAKQLPNPRELVNEAANHIMVKWIAPDHPGTFRRYVLYTIYGKAQQYLRTQGIGEPKNQMDSFIDKLGISRATGYRWFKEGKVPGVTAAPANGRRPPPYLFGQPVDVERLDPVRQKYYLDLQTLDETTIERLRLLKDEVEAKKTQKMLVQKRFDKYGGTRRGHQQWVKRRLAKGMELKDIAQELDIRLEVTQSESQ